MLRLKFTTKMTINNRFKEIGIKVFLNELWVKKKGCMRWLVTFNEEYDELILAECSTKKEADVFAAKIKKLE